MSPELAGLSGIFLFAAAWELAGMRGGSLAARLSPGFRMPGRGSAGLADRLRVSARLTRAGLDSRISPRRFVLAKVGGVAIGLVIGLSALPSAPGRLGPLVVIAMAAAGFVAPDAWAERLARQRRTAMVAALPDALDLVAVGVGTGRTPHALLAEIAVGDSGALASEIAVAVAEIDAGRRQADAFADLKERTGVPELGALAAALERSQSYGSPLAEQLHAQAATLRAEERRRIEERAAKAAPKIQLVVAMVLVPSALLAIAAALVAHSGSLLSAF